MSKPQSPAAQAVHTAIKALWNSSAGLPTMEEVAAAAIRALADQVVPAQMNRGLPEIRSEILAIAAELEGRNG